MKDELEEEQTAAILKALEEALEQGPWDESNFLKIVGKNLREVKERFAAQLSKTPEESKITSHLANRIALRSGQQEIFIALYSTDGINMQSWERILINLPKQMISRPIYADEVDVKAFIRTKENKMNEAYVSIYVSQADILSLQSDKVPVDKLGKPFLTLKDNALTLENINRFVHFTGSYYYSQGRLIKNAQVEEE